MLSVVVVDWKSAEHTARLVPALRRDALASGVPHEIVVVDNAPEDPGRERLVALSEAEEIRLVTPGGNTGFGGGMTAGIAAAKGDLLFLANPDLRPKPGFLAPLLEAVRGADVVGPRLFWDEGLRFHLPPLVLPDLPFELARIRALSGDGEPLRRLSQRVSLRQWSATAPLRVPALVGSALLLPREVWRRTGGFDLGYELYFEETDWFRRHGRGLRTLLVPGSQVVHLGGESSRHDSERERKYLASEARYLSRNWCAPARAVRSFAARRRPPSPATPLSGKEGATLEFPGAGRALVEISPFPTFFPSAGVFEEADRFALPEEIRARLDPGDWWLRVTRLSDRAILRSTSFRKSSAAPAAPTRRA